VTYPPGTAAPYGDPVEPFRNLTPAPTTRPVTTFQPQDAWDDGVDSRPRTIEEVIELQRQQFGGVKIGSAFFGWVTAMGIGAILAGVLAATGAALGLGVMLNPGASAGDLPLDADTFVWIMVGALLVILLVAFTCGGYVAGRMARFSGVVQGLAVWVWTLVIAIVVALVGVVLGIQDDLLGYLSALPRIPLSEDLLTIAGIIAAVVVAVVSLGGAVLGGVTGMRYHRRVDRVGLDG